MCMVDSSHGNWVCFCSDPGSAVRVERDGVVAFAFSTTRFGSSTCVSPVNLTE
jgi:hypothetical protein